MINKFQEGGQAQAQQQQILMQAAQVLQSAGYNITDGQGNLNQQAFIQAVAQYGQEKLGVQVTQQNIGQIIVAIAQQGAKMARKGAKLNYLKKIANSCPEGTQLTYYKAGGQICSKCESIAGEQKIRGVMDGIKKELMQNGGKAVNKKVNAKKQTTTWTEKDDKKFSKLKSKSVQSKLTPQEKKDSTFLQKKYNNSSNKNQFEIEEGKCGGKMKKKLKKNSEGSKLVLKSKVCPKCGKVHAGKCGSKLNKKKKCACGTKIDVKKCGAKMKKKHQFGGILTAMQNLRNKI